MWRRNEHFYGWGPEDAERVRRMEILGYPVGVNTEGPLYHLWIQEEITLAFLIGACFQQSFGVNQNL